jgi:BirA family biotin operon repressor/biotin-[acetyl-CoA-carboxylase] ligase
LAVAPSLSIDAIRSTLTTSSLGRRIELHRVIGSTNREAVALAEAGVIHGTVVLADLQTEGRGRLSRRWFSPPGVNLYCSIVLREPIPTDRFSEWLSWLPLMAALAAAEAIQTTAGIQVAVKWPNDLLLTDRKVGGILCESGPSYQIVGVGINVNGLRSDLPSELQDIATTIYSETKRFTDRNCLINAFLQELEVCLQQWSSAGIEPIRLAYRQRCSTLGKPVKALLAGGQEFIGIAEAIESDGSLHVVQHPIPTDGRLPDRRRLRVADIIHLRS